MAGRLEGKVALITGAARGQGRSHAVRLAEEGADIIAVDICSQLDDRAATRWRRRRTSPRPRSRSRTSTAGSSPARPTSATSPPLQRRSSRRASPSSATSTSSCANAGIASVRPDAWRWTSDVWEEMIDVNLTGVWKTIKAAIPPMIERGNGGSIIITSSTAGYQGFPNLAHYDAAKHGVVGLMRTLAHRAGAAHRSGSTRCTRRRVNTPMIRSTHLHGAVPRPDLANPTPRHGRGFKGLNCLPIPWVEAVDISNAVLWLASDEARYVTGTALPVDAGFCQKIPHSGVRRATTAAATRSPRDVVGRRRELDLVLAAVSAGPRHPAGGPAGYVEVDDPARDHRQLGRAVRARRGQRRAHARRGWSATTTRPGCCARTTARRTSCPARCVEAMQRGGFLYIEELNRAPEDTLNVLLAAMAEREVAVPRVGTIAAVPTFRVRRVDEPVRQRRHRPDLRLGLRPAGAGSPSATRTPPRKRRSSRVRTGCRRTTARRRRGGDHPGHPHPPELRRGCVGARRDRHRRDRRWSWPSSGRYRRPTSRRLVLDAALLALSARIGVDEASEADPGGR